MESRLIPIQSLDDFFNLVDLSSEEEKETLLNDHSEKLTALIQTANDALLFVKKAQQTIIPPYRLFENHPNLFINAFHSANEFIKFCKHEKKDYDFQVDRLIGKNEITKKISSLFIAPEDVIKLTKLNTDLAEELLKDHLPCAQQIVHDRKQFNFLTYHEGGYFFRAGKMALCVAMHVAESLENDKLPTLESVFDFAYAFSNMPRDHRDSYTRSYYQDKPNTNYSVDVEEYFLERFKVFLQSGSKNIINALEERDNFLKLFKLSDKLAFEFLNKAELIKILFPTSMTLDGIKVIAKDYPQLAENLFKKYPERVSSLFQSIAQFREFYEYCEKNTKVRPNKIPSDNVIKFFSSATTSDINDWTWLARHSNKERIKSPYYNHLTQLANGVFEQCSINMQEVFSNAQNISQIVSANAYYANELIEKLRKEKLEPKTLFADQEDFWQFLQSGGTNLVYFSKSILKKYPHHIAYIHAKTNQFRTLDATYLKELFAHDPYRSDWGIAYEIINNLSKTLQEHGGIAVTLKVSDLSLGWGDDTYKPEHLLSFAKSKEDLLAILEIFNIDEKQNFSIRENKQELRKYISSEKCRIPDLLKSFYCPGILNQLGKINSELLTTLIKHHSSDMLFLLDDIQAFLQLKFEHCIEFIKQEPDFFARATAVISFDDILKFFKRNSWELSHQENKRDLNELFARAASTIAKAFISASAETQATAIKNHFSYVKTLLTHAPTVMAPAFSGAGFVKLVKINAAVARVFLEKNKDNLGAIISTTKDIEAINKQNPMLLELFKKQFPNEMEAHLKTLETATSNTAKTSSWCAFYPRRQQPAPVIDTDTNSKPFHLGWII